ncbi:glycosyltransferase involved in cell wall biosynthesis [Pseudoclavibacter sp. JAI123]|uniref:glycosyltransferase family 4 protein n=1 Tax=Pseudoclavibacter sp. JAI123 TaxID=2723065 RepID=UPI0015CB736B|nr:glycosyltransferase family 1 protein [Pseudoclavibacter sp. JAI123]NYF13744.1 glycosyltransferase involved in cell wall biosynthesis [Pseudoclavibacter sp. JAI123]
MRLLFDCRYVRIDRHDGISRYSAELVRALSELHPVTMLISDERQLPMLPDLPHEVISAPTSPAEPFVAREVNRLRPDVVVSPMQTMGSLGRRYGLILTIHDLIYYEHPKPPQFLPWYVRALWRVYHLSFWPQRLLLRGADQVAVVSATTRELLRAKRLTRRPIPLVPNAPDPAFASTPRSAPPSEPSLVYMGSFMPYKNVETLARAMRDLPGWRLHLCSKVDARTLAALEAQAPAGSIVAHQGVSDEEYRALLGRATALVTASKSEGFGLPLVEAMSAGTPILVSDTPIFREVGGTAAGYFPADDAGLLATMAKRLQADPAAWRSASAAGVARAADYAWERSAATLLDACRQVAQRRRS